MMLIIVVYLKTLFLKKSILFGVGGPIFPEYLKSLQGVAEAAKRSGYEINLWVYHEKDYYHTAAKEEITIPNLRLRKIKEELLIPMRSDAFYLGKDPSFPLEKDEIQGERAKLFQQCVEREMVGYKNLAAASDFLRYEILRAEGGYYFDTDTYFPEINPPVAPSFPLEIDPAIFSDATKEAVNKYHSDYLRYLSYLNEYNATHQPPALPVLPDMRIKNFKDDDTSSDDAHSERGTDYGSGEETNSFWDDDSSSEDEEGAFYGEGDGTDYEGEEKLNNFWIDDYSSKDKEKHPYELMLQGYQESLQIIKDAKDKQDVTPLPHFIDNEIPFFGFKGNISGYSIDRDAKFNITNINLNGGGTTNDTLGGVPNNDICKEVILFSMKLYKEADQVKENKPKNLMDAKRDPYAKGDERRNLTITMSGPTALSNAVAKSWDRAQTKLIKTMQESGASTEEVGKALEKAFFSLTLDGGSVIKRAAGVQVITVCHNTWLKRAKNKSAFDTNTIPNLRFFMDDSAKEKKVSSDNSESKTESKRSRP